MRAEGSVLERVRPKKSGVQPRAVLVTRRSEYEELIARHGTRGQARFLTEARGLDLDELERRHERLEAARFLVSSHIPISWRRTSVHREDLDRFLFDPVDIVIVLGQDGLVANVAKYLDGQPVIGLNPDPESYEGVLVPNAPSAIRGLLELANQPQAPFEERRMVTAHLDDGQEICALNEIFIGHASHQSARYRIAVDEEVEAQSSSGIVVSTGTGATGWARSIHRGRAGAPKLPHPTERRLVYFVREAWPSITTGTRLVNGSLGPEKAMIVTSEMPSGGVLFGDGIETDRLEFPWGTTARIGLATHSLMLLKPG